MKRFLTSPWPLLLVSALLYPIPFYLSHYFFWISFIVLTPLVYAGLTQQLSYREGYAWGFISLGLHQAAVFYGLFCMAEGAYAVRLLPILFLLLFCPVFAGISFFLVSTCIQGQTNYLFRAGAWVCGLWGYELWMNYYQLWPFGTCEGYLLLNPLIPIAHCPELLWMLPFLGMPLLLLYLFSCSGMLAIAIVLNRARMWRFTLLLFSLWLFGFLNSPEIEMPACVSRLGVIQRQFTGTGDHPALRKLEEASLQLHKRYPQVQAVLCPESCIQEAELALYHTTKSEDIDQPECIVGGFCYEDYHEELYHNTAYFLGRNNTFRRYYKRHAMALTERMPRGCTSNVIHDLYFKNRPQVCPSTNIRPLWSIAGNVYVPYICSELFFTRQPDDHFAHARIIALCNDLWSPAPVAQLMYLGARFRALEWQRDIVYVSYCYAVFIDKAGKAWPLQTCRSS